MNEQQQNTPSENQRKYLEYLLVRAHARGVPHLPIDGLTRQQVSEWIDYLKGVVGEEGAKSSPSPYIGLRDHPGAITNIDCETYLPVLARTNGYRPNPSTRVRDHDCLIEPWMTEDGHEILECTLCGDQW